MNRDELIQYYTKRLATVKQMWKISDKNTSMQNERAQEYIDHAEKSLEAVKNGRNW